MAKANPLQPSPALLAKLGSLIVHADEYFSPHGHPADKQAYDGIRRMDLEVREWMVGMRKLAMIPEMRRGG